MARCDSTLRASVIIMHSLSHLRYFFFRVPERELISFKMFIPLGFIYLVYVPENLAHFTSIFYIKCWLCCINQQGCCFTGNYFLNISNNVDGYLTVTLIIKHSGIRSEGPMLEQLQSYTVYIRLEEPITK